MKNDLSTVGFDDSAAGVVVVVVLEVLLVVSVDAADELEESTWSDWLSLDAVDDPVVSVLDVSGNSVSLSKVVSAVSSAVLEV